MPWLGGGGPRGGSSLVLLLGCRDDLLVGGWFSW